MDAKEHLAIGVVTAAVIIVILYFWKHISMDPLNVITMAILGALFSLLPDIDHKSGTATWLFLGTGILLIVLGVMGVGIPFIGASKMVLLYGVIILVCTFCLAQFAGHRGPVHTFWFGAICALGIYVVTKQWYHFIVAFSAFYSHLAADGLWDKVY